jgi:hypothetical protein
LVQQRVADRAAAHILSLAGMLRQSTRCEHLVTPSASNLRGYHVCCKRPIMVMEWKIEAGGGNEKGCKQENLQGGQKK